MEEIYYFSGANCNPCKLMKPVIDKLIKEGKKIVKFEVEKDYLKAAEFNITSVPTFVKLTSNFEEEKRSVGIMNINELREF